MEYKVGIICPSEIAFRRFLPSLQKEKRFKYVGIAVATPDEWFFDNLVEVPQDQVAQMLLSEKKKAEKFVESYGGRIYNGYNSLITSPDVDIVYLPLPPALHYKWARRVLENRKHAFVEKPFTTSIKETHSLLQIAKDKNLSVHENYMFIYHKQLKVIQDMIANGDIGKVRLYRVSFGFPRREENDFRYKKALGGGALLDAGGYCLKYGSWLLGESARLVCANSYYESGYEVDIFGTFTMTNDDGAIAQMSFGMDCDYKCELEAWGSKGTLTTGRVLTAPDGYEPEITIKYNQDFITNKLPADDAFEKSIRRFYDSLKDNAIREENYNDIERQSIFVSEFLRLSNNGK